MCVAAEVHVGVPQSVTPPVIKHDGLKIPSLDRTTNDDDHLMNLMDIFMGAR